MQQVWPMSALLAQAACACTFNVALSAATCICAKHQQQQCLAHASRAVHAGTHRQWGKQQNHKRLLGNVGLNIVKHHPQTCKHT